MCVYNVRVLSLIIDYFNISGLQYHCHTTRHNNKMNIESNLKTV